jgi:hypothetical protein
VFEIKFLNEVKVSFVFDIKFLNEVKVSFVLDIKKEKIFK